MTRFEYTIPGEATVQRTFVDDRLQKDSFAVINAAGELVGTVAYHVAMRYWLRQITLAELLTNTTELDD